MANVLVVDDAKVMRFYISKLLKEMGHTVVAEAKDGFEALENSGDRILNYSKYKKDTKKMNKMSVIQKPIK